MMMIICSFERGFSSPAHLAADRSLSLTVRPPHINHFLIIKKLHTSKRYIYSYMKSITHDTVPHPPPPPLVFHIKLRLTT